jgi:peptidoglycan/xylan/chitin deacetylase (PgdA/CDA1 family)
MKKLIYNLLGFLNPVMQGSSKNLLRVLAYHTAPNPGLFEKQLLYLSSNYNVIDIALLREHLFHGSPLPPKPVLITFDDGDISIYENGLPLLKKYGLPSIMFIITGLIGSRDMFWCRQVEAAYEAEGKGYLEARKKIKELKSLRNKERREYLRNLNQFDARQLTVKELRELEKGNMYIANHTHTHPMVDKCTPEEIREELDVAIQKFKDWGLEGHSVFAYPNGNWDRATEGILKEKKIEMAFLFDHKLNKKKIDPMRISRIRVDTYTGLDEFKVKVSGLHSRLMHFKERLQ